MDVTGDRRKIQCCKEQYCIGTWNVRSMNQGTLEVVKQEIARVNIDILGISKLKWTGMGEFNSDDHYIYYGVLFLLWLHPFILSGVISPLISSSILDTYRPGEFLFQYPIILAFHTVHGVLKHTMPLIIRS